MSADPGSNVEARKLLLAVCESSGILLTLFTGFHPNNDLHWSEKVGVETLSWAIAQKCYYLHEDVRTLLSLNSEIGEVCNLGITSERAMLRCIQVKVQNSTHRLAGIRTQLVKFPLHISGVSLSGDNPSRINLYKLSEIIENSNIDIRQLVIISDC